MIGSSLQSGRSSRRSRGESPAATQPFRGGLRSETGVRRRLKYAPASIWGSSRGFSRLVVRRVRRGIRRSRDQACTGGCQSDHSSIPRAYGQCSESGAEAPEISPANDRRARSPRIPHIALCAVPCECDRMVSCKIPHCPARRSAAPDRWPVATVAFRREAPGPYGSWGPGRLSQRSSSRRWPSDTRTKHELTGATGRTGAASHRWATAAALTPSHSSATINKSA